MVRQRKIWQPIKAFMDLMDLTTYRRKCNFSNVHGDLYQLWRDPRPRMDSVRIVAQSDITTWSTARVNGCRALAYINFRLLRCPLTCCKQAKHLSRRSLGCNIGLTTFMVFTESTENKHHDLALADIRFAFNTSSSALCRVNAPGPQFSRKTTKFSASPTTLGKQSLVSLPRSTQQRPPSRFRERLVSSSG
jgi:hypothetical protein